MTETDEFLQILFIDDDPWLLNIAQLYLEKVGSIKITPVSDVRLAMKMLEETTFDAIVSDYHMPNMDGIGLLIWLKEKKSNTPFIIYTGKGREEVVIEALNKGADFYIQKSGDPRSEFTELASKIRYAVNRRVSERELKNALANLKRSQKIAHIGNWILDLENHTFKASEEALAIFGYPPTYQPTSSEIKEIIHPEDREMAHAALEHLLQTGEPYNIDTRIFKYDSGELRHVQSQGQLFKSDSDSPVRIFGTNLDITDRKKTEEALSKTNSFLENLIAVASVPIIILDMKGIITRINRSGEELIGLSSDQIIGRSIQNLFPPDQADNEMDLILTTSCSTTRKTIELDILHSSGIVKTVLWNSATLYDSDGITPVATIAQGQDITEQLRVEQQRDIAELQIQQNLAQLAILNDGIRNPLMAISGYAELYENPEITMKILKQVELIDEMVARVDRRWAESEKILNFLRKHCEVDPETTESALGEALFDFRKSNMIPIRDRSIRN
jgi:PAS domain S-box-containing protein